MVPPSSDLVRRITQLEELVTHQEHLLQQLNDVIVSLRVDHDSIREAFLRRVDRLEAQLEALETPGDPNEKPPHY